MLQFWKKSGQKDKLEKTKKNQSPSKLPVAHISNGDISGCMDHNTIVDYLSEFSDEELGNSEGKVTVPRSQLSKTLAEVLSDKGALGYFIQYLEAQDQLSLIKFWLDVESFRAAASTRNFDDAPITPVARDQLEVFDDPTRLSPQPSQRSTGTDCDSLFDSPSHSIDSGEHIYPDNTCSRILGRPGYKNDNQEIRSSTPVTTKDTSVHNTVRCDGSSTVNTRANDRVLKKAVSHPLEDILHASVIDNRTGTLARSSNVIGNKGIKCDQSVVASSCYNPNDKYVASDLNYKRTDSSECVCNGTRNIQSIEDSNILKKESAGGLFCDRCSVVAKESENNVTDGVVKASLTLQSDTELSTVNFNALTSPMKGSEKRTKRPICGNILQAVVDDAIRIYGKYLSLGSVHKVPVNNAIKEGVILAICKEDGCIDTETFTEAQAAIFHIMEMDHFNNFLHSEYHCKHQIDVLTSGKVTMADILYNETALFYFMEFMEQEGNRHLVEFWLAAVNFHQHLLSRLGNYDPFEAQNDAMILYDKYFSLQATSPLGFGDQIRFAVEQDICRDEGPLPDCFTRPVTIVQHALQKNFLQPFLTSQLHFKYLSELVNTIQANPSLLSRKGKSGSECSSEWNISVQNTLLASEDTSSVSKRALQGMSARELSIDSYQLNDPDSLWKRRHRRGLSFGRINPMGRFETDVEPEPDRKEESRITKVVKKLVNMEEDKAKEEMAWQIAEMIVNDITSLTLGSGEPVQS